MTTKKQNRYFALLVALAAACSSDVGGKAGNDKTALDRSGPLSLPSMPILPTDNSGNVTPGALPGSFSVGGDGRALYSMPLWVPPGRAGVQPSLSLQYDSNSNGDGLLGHGWSLAGLSQISRCDRTAADDGLPGPVLFEVGDAYCLDGERLILVAGTRGTAGAEYRTRRNSFTRLVVDSVDDSGPVTWTAYTRDDRILTFGDPQLGAAWTGNRVTVTPNANLGEGVDFPPNTLGTAPTPARLMWALSEVRDRPGNMMSISWTAQAPVTIWGIQVQSPTVLVPTQITYTSLTSLAVSLPSTRSVKLFYSPDSTWNGKYKEFGYIAGFPWQRDHRLDHIEMWGPNPTTPALLRKYSFNYSTPSVTGRLLLESVTASDQFGVSMGATHFQWEAGSTSFVGVDSRVNDMTNTTADHWLVATDVDGDGKSDLLYIPQKPDNSGEQPTIWVRFSNGTGFGAPVDTGITYTPNNPDLSSKHFWPEYPPIPIDMDGDGKRDLVLGVPWSPTGDPSKASPAYCAFQNMSTSKSAVSFSNRGMCGAGGATVGDINGDGKDDVLTCQRSGSSPQWQIYMSGPSPDSLTIDNLGNAGPNPFDHPLSSIPSGFPNGFDVPVLDIDGAGMATMMGGTIDLITTDTPTSRYSNWAMLETSFGPVLSIPTLPGTLYYPQQFSYLDINGDGLNDAAVVGHDEIYVNGSFPDTQKYIQININTGNGFSDHNGVKGSDGFYQYLASSLGAPAISPNAGGNYGAGAIDVDGDGRQDLIIRLSGAPDSSQQTTFTGQLVLERSLGDSFAPLTVISSIVDGAATGYEQQALDVNGDGLDDLITWDSGALILYMHPGKKPDMLTQVVDGLGATTSVTYSPISDASVYTPGSGCTYPQLCVQSGLWVVSAYSASNGNGGVNTFDYTYSDARRDVRGRGYLGMSSRTMTDAQTGATDTATYDLLSYRNMSFYPFADVPESQTQTVPLDSGRTRVTTTKTTYVPNVDDSDGVYFVYPQTTDLTTSETTAAGTVLLSTTHTVRQVDQFDNVVDELATTGDGNIYHHQADYSNDEPNWLIQKLTLATDTSTTAAQETKVRRRAFTYDSIGQLLQDIIEPGDKSGDSWAPRPYTGPGDDGVQTLYRTYDRTPAGLVAKMWIDYAPTTAAPSLDVRTFELVYDSTEQMFLSSSTDALTHKVRYAIYPGLGVVSSSDDFNGVLTTVRVDGFARLRHEDTVGADSRDINYSALAGSPADTPLLSMAESRATGSTRTQSFDMLNRPRMVQVNSRQDGQIVQTDLTYDDLGRGVQSRSLPHFTTVASPPARSFDYDSIGRIRHVYEPDKTMEQLVYDGLTTHSFDAKGNERYQTTDQLGRVVKSVEVVPASGNVAAHEIPTIYGYGPFNTLESVTDEQGNSVSFVNDRLGRRIEVVDPDAGQRDSQYNAFGDLWIETVAKGSAVAETSTCTYDQAGRLTQLQNGDGTTQWNWDTAANGIGLIDSTVSPDTTVGHTYDDNSRPQNMTWTVQGQQLTIRRDYDPQGRLQKLTYPIINGRTFAVDYTYALAGELQFISDDAPPKPHYYTVLDSDASGNPTNASRKFPQASYGNGLTYRRTEDPMRPGYLAAIDSSASDGTTVQHLDVQFDPNGNLLLRNDTKVGSSEQFGYDFADRVNTWTWTVGATTRNVGFGYDDIGNFRTRTVAENSADNVTYSYDRSNNAGPHAITALNGVAYGYDTKGKQTSAPGRKQVTYNAFELPSQITTASNSNVHFGYDASHERVFKVTDGGDKSITLGGGLYEQRIDSSGNVTHLFTVQSDIGPVMQRIWSTGSADQTYYLHADQLGSVDTITGDMGQLLERLKYDPYGQRVQPTQLDQVISASALGERTGFTGQEHDDDLTLINMNGRSYDPVSGRFLSTDPLVSDPYYGQAYNRYAYVQNNPLNFVDPSGFDPVDNEIGSNNWPDISLPVPTLSLDWNRPQLNQPWVGLPDPPPPKYLCGAGLGGEPLYCTEKNPFESLNDRSHPMPDRSPRTAGKVAWEWVSGLVDVTLTAVSLADGAELITLLEKGVQVATTRGGVVLIDSNVVFDLAKDPTLRGRLAAGERGVVSYVTGPELRNAIARRGAGGVPRALQDLSVLGERPSIDGIINVRGYLLRLQGRFGDGIIGAQSLELRIPLITNDAELARVVRALGGVVR